MGKYVFSTGPRGGRKEGSAENDTGPSRRESIQTAKGEKCEYTSIYLYYHYVYMLTFNWTPKGTKNRIHLGRCMTRRKRIHSNCACGGVSIYMHAYIYIHIYIYICAYIHIYIYTYM